jgi:hypothetical protein
MPTLSACVTASETTATAKPWPRSFALASSSVDPTTPGTATPAGCPELTSIETVVCSRTR